MLRIKKEKLINNDDQSQTWRLWESKPNIEPLKEWSKLDLNFKKLKISDSFEINWKEGISLLKTSSSNFFQIVPVKSLECFGTQIARSSMVTKTRNSKLRPKLILPPKLSINRGPNKTPKAIYKPIPLQSFSLNPTAPSASLNKDLEWTKI